MREALEHFQADGTSLGGSGAFVPSGGKEKGRGTGAFPGQERPRRTAQEPALCEADYVFPEGGTPVTPESFHALRKRSTFEYLMTLQTDHPAVAISNR